MILSSLEIRQRFLEFFKKKGHGILPSASIVPENDPSVLFTTAGMQSLVPYLLGEKHPLGTRLANVQKCVRLTDIEEVGDATHLTFFEMLGNWSLGDYFKKESIDWSMDFLTSGEYGLGINPDRLYISIFSGDEESPQDKESITIWKEAFANLGIDARIHDQENLDKSTYNLEPSYRIFLLGKKDNWWPAGGKHPGPQGPDTEIFYYWGKGPLDLEKERPGYNDNNFWEIWNNVFMEYRHNGGYKKLSQRNVDTGMGLERVCAIMEDHPDIYLTELFKPLIKILEQESNIDYARDSETTRAMRVIADHIRTTVFILGDDSQIVPSNLGKGYVLRRLIRRALRYKKVLNVPEENNNVFEQLARAVVENYGNIYPELGRNFNFILEELKKEEERFHNALEKGLKEWEKISQKGGGISGNDAFNLFSTYGFPLELTQELAREKGLQIDEKAFNKAFEKHQKISRDGAEKRFKGGLVDESYETTKLHTATHLLQASLRAVLGDHVTQKGSNITAERLRFDFTYPKKMNEEERQKVQDLVNNAIKSNLSVEFSEMPFEKAVQGGALGFFESRYGELVKVYTIGSPDQPFSKEICGGPHVKNTGELGQFKIIKEEAVSAGVRRIKAVLE